MGFIVMTYFFCGACLVLASIGFADVLVRAAGWWLR